MEELRDTKAASGLPFDLDDFESRVRECVVRAMAIRQPLRLIGGGTKDFYGNALRGEPLELSTLTSADESALLAAVDHDAAELVVSAPAVLPLGLLEQRLAEAGQMLAFEPPRFASRDGMRGTVGGCVAAGLAGPRRRSAGPWQGGVRDFVLGARLVDGRGRVLTPGGRVMKNVAGFDLARALAGSLGFLGIITQVSLKVLPRPAAERTLLLETGEADALRLMVQWAARPLPISATAWREGRLWVRLSGAVAAVESATRMLGGEPVVESAAPSAGSSSSPWHRLRDHDDDWFWQSDALWRCALPPTAPPLGLPGGQWIEWGGTQRWLRTEASGLEVRERVAALGGHVTLFRGAASDEREAGVFAPLSPPLLALHRRLKAEFDPAGILNPGRLVAGL